MNKMQLFFSVSSCGVCTELHHVVYTGFADTRENETVSPLSDKKDAPVGVLQI